MKRSIRQPIFLLAALVMCAAGCVSRQPATPGRLDSAGAGAAHHITWPERFTARAVQVAAAAPEWSPGDPLPKNADGSPAEYVVSRVEAVGQGVIRELVHLDSSGNLIEPDRNYLHFFSWSDPADAVTDEVVSEAAVDPFMVGLSPNIMELTRNSGPAEGGSARKGLVVHLRSLGDTDYEQSVVDELRSRGWNTLSMPFVIQLERGLTMPVDSKSDIDAVAEIAARYLDDRAASRAYAIEAALAYLRLAHPEIDVEPLVIVGFSAGALIAPAVAARMIDDVDAVVMVCGGANVLDIAEGNALGDVGILVNWKDAAVRKQVRPLLIEEYLKRSQLDPYQLGLVLRSIPILLLNGRFDAVVPTANGDLLYERLGRPDRWIWPGGHGMVFWSLPQEKQRIADWLNCRIDQES